MPKSVAKLVEKLVKCPPLEWREAVSQLRPAQRDDLINALDDQIIRSAALRAYTEHIHLSGTRRLTDEVHAKAVRNCNRLASRIRKVLGYLIPGVVFKF